MKSAISTLVRLLVVLAAVASCVEADSIVRVRMIDARSGSPIPNSAVRLWASGIVEEPNDPGYIQQLTNSTGVATFHLADPLPSYLYIHVGMRGPWQECFPDARDGFVTREILESGASKEGTCWKLPNIANKFHAAPGDVYIFAVHDSFMERLRALSWVFTSPLGH